MGKVKRRLIDAGALRAEILKPCMSCALNGGKFCRDDCKINELIRLLDNAPTVMTKEEETNDKRADH